jgi:hypothetical protein
VIELTNGAMAPVGTRLTLWIWIAWRRALRIAFATAPGLTPEVSEPWVALVMAVAWPPAAVVGQPG